jgi:hypothetical protein
MVVLPVLVTVWAPSTEKLPAAPKPGDVAASGRAETSKGYPANERHVTRMIKIVKFFILSIFHFLSTKQSTFETTIGGRRQLIFQY